MPEITMRALKCSRGDGRARFIIGVGSAILGHATAMRKKLLAVSGCPNWYEERGLNGLGFHDAGR
jgi:hypothetical protein